MQKRSRGNVFLLLEILIHASFQCLFHQCALLRCQSAMHHKTAIVIFVKRQLTYLVPMVFLFQCFGALDLAIQAYQTIDK